MWHRARWESSAFPVDMMTFTEEDGGGGGGGGGRPSQSMHEIDVAFADVPRLRKERALAQAGEKNAFRALVAQYVAAIRSLATLPFTPAAVARLHQRLHRHLAPRPTRIIQR